MHRLGVACVIVGLLLVFAGGAWYLESTTTDLADEGRDAATALEQLLCERDGGADCLDATNSEDREQPARLAVSAVGVAVVVAGVALLTRRQQRS
jgi:hypothetical protein